MTMNGTSRDLETSHVPGSHNTLSDIRCKFPRSHSKRSALSSIGFITGYKIAVSNNNKNFSEAHAVYILDSTCQDTLNVSGQLRFALKVKKNAKLNILILCALSLSLSIFNLYFLKCAKFSIIFIAWVLFHPWFMCTWWFSKEMLRVWHPTKQIWMDI